MTLRTINNDVKAANSNSPTQSRFLFDIMTHNEIDPIFDPDITATDATQD
jgi:hypothetical protein